MNKAEMRIEAARIRRVAATAGAGERLASGWTEALRAATVAGYIAIGDEIDPALLLRRLARAGARLCLPETPPRGSGRPLTFRRWSFGEPLVRSAFGVPEPGPDAEAVEPDLLLVPLLAFDPRGGRLGYGAGHYDRTLRGLRARRRVTAIGLAYAAQERDDLSLEAHDEPLDGFLTEKGYMPVRKDG